METKSAELVIVVDLRKSDILYQFKTRVKRFKFMYICDRCQMGYQVGMNVSHSHCRTKTKRFPTST